MTQTGVVEKLLDRDYAQVRVNMRSACGHDCADCGGSCSAARELHVRARNRCHAKAGDTVTIATETGSVMKAAAAVYLLPVLLLLLGYAACAAVELPERLCAVASVAALFVGLGLAVLIDRRMKKKRKFQYEILDKQICSDM